MSHLRGKRACVLSLTLALALAAAFSTTMTGAPAMSTVSTLPPLPWKAAAVAHAGVGTAPEHADGCVRAVDAALAALAAGADPLDAAVAGVLVLEDDPRFNAGTGAIVRLDGSVQMDAAVMDSSGRFGAVAGVERVQNPVKVARAVLGTPHLLLMGDGATRFARALGLPDYDPTTPERTAATERLKERIRKGDPTLPPFWRTPAWREHWNYAQPPEALGLGVLPANAPASDGRKPDGPGADTVGVAVRGRDGRFGVALSTGGTAVMLRGRVGDVPIYGAGLYAGAHGAAAATGAGERIMEKLLAHTIHGWLSGGTPAEEAARRAVALVDESFSTGVIVVSPTTLATAANRPMAWAGREEGGPMQQPAAPSRP